MQDTIFSNEINGVILAGGLSTRYGSCKSKLKLDEESILKNTYELLSKHCSKVSISCRKEKKIEGYPCIYDHLTLYAPIAGIYTALEFYKSPLLVLSCDLPFIDNSTIEKLIIERNKAVEIKDDLYMTTYQKGGTEFIESLVAIYEYKAKDILKKALEEEKLSLNRAIPKNLRHHILYSQEEEHAFFNINYPKDMVEAKEISNNLQNCKKRT